MKVMKFGGTSVGSAQRMKNVAKLALDGERNILVLSAMSGTTNSLLEICDYYQNGNTEGAAMLIQTLKQKYFAHAEELLSQEKDLQQLKDFLFNVFQELSDFAQEPYSEGIGKIIVSKGEILSTNMMFAFLKAQGVPVTLLNSFDFMKTDEEERPDQHFLNQKLRPIIAAYPDTQIFIAQGFICKDAQDCISNLQRGGSDYTASLIGASIHASEIQIWTDIDGMHNNDPRVVDNTQPVPQLSFEEAAELAYFGAKILHPTCILPAKNAGIPVKLLNTMDPLAAGTIINNQLSENNIKAIAAKDNITAVKIVSSRMLLATGFLRKVFEIFEKYNTSIDMITTSEVGISMSIDNSQKLEEITAALRKYGMVEVHQNMCIICVVGDLRMDNTGIPSFITEALKEIPIRMVSYGGSEHNISFLIHQADKKKALCALSQHLFNA